MSIRVLLVDDHPVFRAGLHSLLDDEPDIDVVGEAQHGNAAVAGAREQKPTVVVMDVSMPELNGIEATRQITEALDDVQVLCVSLHADGHMVSAMLEAGAAGYALKSAPATELVEAIRLVAEGRTYLSPSLVGGVVSDYVRHLSEARLRGGSRLTEREVQVLQLIAEGVSTADIASRLGISPKTVGSHRAHIMEKLDVGSVAGLTKYAIRHGISTSERAEGQ